MPTLNLGIVAHVDAGKTSLTERLLHGAGVIDELGSVDDGNTQTDQLALERRRGITIRSAVVSLDLDGVAVNLIDTPGHPDFIAEVERVLDVLDGAVLVVSAVEGVQAQTRILYRTLQRLTIPTLLFVNKVDRRGARDEAVLEDLSRRLTSRIVAMNEVRDLGGRSAAVVVRSWGDRRFVDGVAELVADHDERILIDYLDDTRTLDPDRVRAALVNGVGRAELHPVLFGSAITGAGVDQLVDAITGLLPAARCDPDDDPAGVVFKIDRGPDNNRRAYVRMNSGCLQVRDRLVLRGQERKITGIEVFAAGSVERAEQLAAGRIGIVRGLGGVRIGDVIGEADPGYERHFAPPTLEAIVDPVRREERAALLAALKELEEQDPLIGVRQDDARREVSVTLYGEVQKEVIQATLADEYGIAVTFRRTTTICVERLRGSGDAVESSSGGRTDEQPFLATVGLRVDPAAHGSGVVYQRASEVLGTMPAAFFNAVEEAVDDTLRQGPHGWQVTDCIVTLTHTGYWPRQSASHQTFDRAVSSTAGDFRHLTPLVLMAALESAGTVVCEPIHRFRLEIPADVLAIVLPALTSRGAVLLTTHVDGLTANLEGDVPAAQVHALHQRLPGLTRGEALLTTDLHRWEPVRRAPPTRRRTDHDPRDRKAYLLRVGKRVQKGR